MQIFFTLVVGAFTAIDRIFGVLDQKEFIAGVDRVEEIKGKIEFRHVGFSYSSDEGANRILRDVDFTVAPGTSLALVGATGSGKSTIIKLISRLYDGYTGDILIDDRDIKTLDPTSLRNQVAIVPQDIALFEGSIAFNIGLGLTEDIEKIKVAAEAVGADQFIDRLPGGYEAHLGEQGGGLSQGQKQLIVFARALVRDPGLVILDEATSSVDPDSERIIQEATTRILAGRSVIVIAHRLSTIRLCDQILVINRGEVVESGSHDALMSAKSHYHKLAQALS